jgi:hypothetical protein
MAYGRATAVRRKGIIIWLENGKTAQSFIENRWFGFDVMQFDSLKIPLFSI